MKSIRNITEQVTLTVDLEPDVVGVVNSYMRERGVSFITAASDLLKFGVADLKSKIVSPSPPTVKVFPVLKAKG